MRMGFIMGGIIGAAAAMYLTRNNRGIMHLTSMDQAGSVGKMMRDAKGMLQGAAMKALDNTLSGSSSKEADMEQVESIINKDPELKHQVDEILSDSNASYRSH